MNMSIDAHPKKLAWFSSMRSSSGAYKLLDLCCGEGLASWGYWRSGCFSEIVGVDIDPKFSDRYSFDFVCADAMTLDYDFLLQFDFIHASPPCQAYSKITPDKSIHPRLIAPMHHMLFATGKPYVIENVEGSGQELRPNLVMDGGAFNLPIKRIRYFHVSMLQKPIRLISSAAASQHPHGAQMTRSELIAAFGLADFVSTRGLAHLTCDGIEQGIPPIKTAWIAQTFVGQKFMIG